MGKASKIGPCVDCQEMFPRKELNRMGRCHDCAWKALGESAYQLHIKEGPYYEKWKERCTALSNRYLDGIKGG